MAAMDAPARRPEPMHAADVVRDVEPDRPSPVGAGGSPLHILREALPELEELRGGRVLDVRANGGDVVRADLMRQLLAGAEVEPVDLDEPAVERTPRLPFDDDAVDGVVALSLFAGAARGWAGWLVELRRVLRPGGLLIAGVLGRDHMELVAGRPWSPDDIGLRVLGPPDGGSGAVAVVSPWWLRAHWGRAFEVVRHEPLGSSDLDGIGLAHREVVVARPGPEGPTTAELERDEPGEPREQRARAHDVEATREELRATAARLRDLTTRHAELTRMWEHAVAHTERLEAAGVGRDERIVHLEARVVELERGATREVSADAALRSERQAARRQHAELLEKLREHQEELARVRRILHVVHTSKSWRLTAPLRARAASIRGH